MRYCFWTIIVATLILLLLAEQTQSQAENMAENENEESFFLRLQKSGRHPMKAFINRFPYHNPMFQLRETQGQQRPFSGF